MNLSSLVFKNVPSEFLAGNCDSRDYESMAGKFFRSSRTNGRAA